MFKKLLITGLLSIYGVVAQAQYNGPQNAPQAPVSSEFGNTPITQQAQKFDVLNQTMSLAVHLGAASSRCATLTEVIIQGWPQVKMAMLQDVAQLGFSQAEYAISIERAFQSSRYAPESANLIQDCDSVLNEMYKFQATH